MKHWQRLATHPRSQSILLAIAQHDNGWQEPDAAPPIDPATGRIYDFISAPAALRQGVWPRAVERLSHNPWAAALVAQHAITVYDRFRNDSEWDAFFARMEAARDRYVADTPLSATELHEDYPYVRIGDLISLIFCNRWSEERYRDWTFSLDGVRVSVSPDPFGGRDVPFEITAVEVGDIPYTSDEELRSALGQGSRVVLGGVVSGRR
jgi:hypothetical protein